jgi:hypothetical protein
MVEIISAGITRSVSWQAKNQEVSLLIVVYNIFVYAN